jgi:hypothetical protein
MRKKFAESDVIVLHEFPKIDSYELITIVDNAKRGYTNPAVARYKSSFITIESGMNWLERYPRKYARAVVTIPRHAWTLEEPWFSDFAIGDFTTRKVLRRSMDFVELAETFNYQMHEVAKQSGYENLLKGIGQR